MKLLKQSLDHEESLPDSYYDPTSSHYLGGAHNAAMLELISGNIP